MLRPPLRLRQFMNGGAMHLCAHPECGERFVGPPWHGKNGKLYCCGACRADNNDEPDVQDLARRVS